MHHFSTPIKRLIWIGITYIAFSSAQAQTEIITSTKNCFLKADARALAGNFGERVDISIDDEKTNYLNDKATSVLSSFFSKYPISDFEYIHQGASKQGAQYAIGRYSYTGGAFRVFILIKEQNGKFVIDLIDFGEE